MMHRRDFLKWMAAMGVGILGQHGWAQAAQRSISENSRWDSHIQVPDWTGDSFPPMHRIRDGHNFPIPKPSQKVDVVIIGGGLSGLTAAYQLRDEDLLILERENTLGGNAKQGQFQGIPYSIGAAYMADIGPPFGALYSELGLEPKPVKTPVDTGSFGGQWMALSESPLATSFQKLQRHLAKLSESEDFPKLPIQTATESALKLDQTSFYEYLKADYPQDLLDYIDAYCYSSLGGSIHQVSAYAGINFYSEIAQDIYAFPGGNSVVAKRLTQRINLAGSGRFKTGVSVYRIQQVGNEVHTTFFYNDAPDHYETIASQAAIVSVPYYFAARILPDLPDLDRQLMLSCQYGAYLVANCCFDRLVFHGGYDNWTPHNPAFTDFIDATYVDTHRPQPGSVITIYAPFRNAKAGRSALLQGQPKVFAHQILKGLREVISFPQSSLKEIRLTRYGHQMLTSNVGLITPLRGLRKSHGQIVLAHSDGQGMAAIESAVWEGLEAAKIVQQKLSSHLLHKS